MDKKIVLAGIGIAGAAAGAGYYFLTRQLDASAINVVDLQSPQFYVGTQATVTATFRNTTTKPATQSVSYGIRDILTERETLSLQPAEEQTIQFSYTPPTDGMYELFAQPTKSWREVDISDPSWMYSIGFIETLGEMIY